MNKLLLIRFAALIAIRDVLVPGGGLFLALYLPLAHSLEPWHLPLVAGMLGTPLVGRGTPNPKDPDEDA